MLNHIQKLPNQKNKQNIQYRLKKLITFYKIWSIIDSKIMITFSLLYINILNLSLTFSPKVITCNNIEDRKYFN